MPRIYKAVENEKMKMLQIKLNRCKLALDLMHQCAIELRPDIIIISEPNRHLYLTGLMTPKETPRYGSPSSMANFGMKQQRSRATG